VHLSEEITTTVGVKGKRADHVGASQGDIRVVALTRSVDGAGSSIRPRFPFAAPSAVSVARGSFPGMTKHAPREP